MAYLPKYYLFLLLAVVALLSLLIQSAASEKTMLMSYNQAMEDLMSCEGTGTLLAKVNVSPMKIKSICEYLKHVALSAGVNQDKVSNDVDISAADQSNVNPQNRVVLMNVARFRLNRYKNFETMAFRPTAPGPSPGVGHNEPPTELKCRTAAK
ncbi:hypothetical protein OROMI_022996 [Orobanche minor]